MKPTMGDEDTRYMELALEEASKGLGRTSPNPAVGAVVVQNCEVVGRGYHKKAGTAHAEVNALADAGERAAGGTLYVTLEPCNHTGRTPPCTRAILASGLSRVVIGMADPNPLVTGGGADFLKAQGLEVRSGVLEDRCRALNYPFIKHSATGWPWVIIKAAVSLDGKITLRPRQGEAISGPESHRSVHELRNRVDAILIGVETAIIDNPSLTTRLADVENRRDPVRVILDTSLRLSETSRLLNQDSPAETLVICGQEAPEDKAALLAERGATVCRLPRQQDGRIDLRALLALLGKRNITTLLVEGGARVHGAFYSQHLFDELWLYYAPFLAGDLGTPLVSGYALPGRDDAPILTKVSVQRLGNDILYRAFRRQAFVTG